MPAEATVFVERQRRGRRGKTVTTAGPIPLSRAEAKGLVGELRRLCGSGGTLRRESDDQGGLHLHVEIQGDHADRLQRELSARGFAVKRRGG